MNQNSVPIVVLWDSMGIFDAIILGVVQGITEFLPVSSSGHLIVVRDMLGMNTEGDLAFDIMLHLATLLVILVYFHKRIARLVISVFRLIVHAPVAREDIVLIIGVIVGTIPAVVVGGLWGDEIAGFFREPLWVAVALIVGSALFYIAERVDDQDKSLTLRSSLIIGLFQVLAFIPGTSRSGITIAGGLFSGIKRETAAYFSFLLAIPAIAGAGLLQAFDGSLNDVYAVGWPAVLGSISAFVAGLCAVHFLMRFVQTHKLDVFVWYRLALAGLIILGVLIM